MTLVQFDTTLADAADDRVLHERGVRRERGALEARRPARAAVSSCVATVFAVLQNVIGVLLAVPLGQIPLFGVLAGSVTLTGGPATGLAFAPLFEQAGVAGAPTIAVAAAMAGIVSGGIVGGPVGTFLIDRHVAVASRRPARSARRAHTPLGELVEGTAGSIRPAGSRGRGRRGATRCSSTWSLMLVAMWSGRWVSDGFAALGLHAARLHRRDARRGCHPQPRRCHRLVQACRSATSTISAAWRSRCSWCSR